MATPKFSIPVDDAEWAREVVEHDPAARVMNGGRHGTYVLCDDPVTAMKAKLAGFDETKANLPLPKTRR